MRHKQRLKAEFYKGLATKIALAFSPECARLTQEEIIILIGEIEVIINIGARYHIAPHANRSGHLALRRGD